MSNPSVKFLLVDDLEANLIALEGLVRRDGLETHLARSGQEALELLLQHDFALAFIDVQMPGMDGFELAEIMRGTERTRRVPIIFLTAGLIDSQRRFRGYETGAVDFLFKPIEPHILRTKAGVFFDLFRQHQELLARAEENARLLQESRHYAAQLRETKDQLATANQDLEERVRERTAKLREMVAELEYFSYTITHDMRAPLRAMQAFAMLLTTEKSAQLDEEALDFLRRITESASRMDHLIRDALNYNKLVRTELELQPVDPGDLLRGMVQSYPELGPSKLNLEVADPLPTVLANPAGLTQCFSNLLGNAVKFARPGIPPRVRVWAECHDASVTPAAASNGPPKVRLWFEDNGIGIPADQQERIFQIFYRLDPDKEGTGIGLALVRKAAERMRGRAGVVSHPGQGSRFWLELHAAPADPQPGP